MPPAMGLSLLLLLCLQALPLAHAQTTINVTVGVAGSFFDPRSVSAAEGDTVNFIFAGDFHDVTQSTFEAPCTPLKGGFSSGFFGRGANFDGNETMWSLTVTNASAPIWFFCAATRPVSHCVTSGMVGAINPPSQDMFLRFVSAAQNVSSTPMFFPTLGLTGSGAIGATPTVIITATPAAIASSSSSPNAITTSASDSSSASASSSSNHGAVIGGAVGAAVGAVLLLFLGGCLCYRAKKQHRISQNSSFFSYNPNPNQQQHQSMNTTVTSAKSTFNSAANSPNYITAFDIERESNVMMQKQPLLPMASPAMAEYPNTLAPQRYNTGKGYSAGPSQSAGTFYGDPSSINRQRSYNAMATPSSTPTHIAAADGSSTTNDSGAGIDLHTLAKEVVAVLRHEKMAGDVSPATTAPPHYRTVNE